MNTRTENENALQESFEKLETIDNLLERQLSLGDIERDEMNQQIQEQEKIQQQESLQGGHFTEKLADNLKKGETSNAGLKNNNSTTALSLISQQNLKNLERDEQEQQFDIINGTSNKNNNTNIDSNKINQSNQRNQGEEGKENHITFVQNQSSTFMGINQQDSLEQAMILEKEERKQLQSETNFQHKSRFYQQKQQYNKAMNNNNNIKQETINSQNIILEQENKVTSKNNQEKQEEQSQSVSSEQSSHYSSNPGQNNQNQTLKNLQKGDSTSVKVFPQGYIMKLKEGSIPGKNSEQSSISPSSIRSIPGVQQKKDIKQRHSGGSVGFVNDPLEETPTILNKKRPFVFSSKFIDDPQNENNEDAKNFINYNTMNNSFISRIAGGINEGTQFKGLNTSPQKKTKQRSNGWNFAVKLKNINRFINKIRDQTSEGNYTRLLPRHLNLIKDASFSPEGGSSQFFDIEKKLSSTEEILAKIQVFEPDDFYLVLFKCLLLFIITVEVFILPVEVGFSIDLLFLDGLSKLFLRDIPIGLFSLDLLIRFNTGYYLNGSLMIQRSKILRHFSFIIIVDFLNILALICQNLVDYKFLIGIFLLRMLLLHQKSSDLIENFSILERYPAIYNLIKLVFIQLLVGHISGCGFHFISTIDVWDNLETSWIKYYGFYELTTASRYLLSIYYSTITMITVGYGDITPRNTLERIYVITIVIISGTVFAYTVNMIGAIFQEKEKKVADYKQMKSDISNYMINRQISKKTQLKVFNYLEYINQKANESPEKGQMILSKISESLKNDVYREFYGQILTNSKLFHNKFSAGFIQKVSLKMEEKMNGAGEIILLEGSQQQPILYYILKGKVEMFSSREDKRYSLGFLNQGDSFGHRCFHSSAPQEWSAVTAEVTHLVYVTQKNFLECVKDFPSDLETYMVMKDEIIFGQNRFMNPCYSCGKMTHVSIDCPLIHYHRNKQLCVNKYLYYAPQKDRCKFTRDRVKYNVLQEVSICREQLKMYRMGLNLAIMGNAELEAKETETLESESDEEFFKRMYRFHFDEDNNLLADSISNNDSYSDEDGDEEDSKYSEEYYDQFNNQEPDKTRQNQKKITGISANNNNNNINNQLTGFASTSVNNNYNHSPQQLGESTADSLLHHHDQIIDGTGQNSQGKQSEDKNSSNSSNPNNNTIIHIKNLAMTNYQDNTPSYATSMKQKRKKFKQQKQQFNSFGEYEDNSNNQMYNSSNSLPGMVKTSSGRSKKIPTNIQLQNIQEDSESISTFQGEKSQIDMINSIKTNQSSAGQQDLSHSTSMFPFQPPPPHPPSLFQQQFKLQTQMQPIRLHNHLIEQQQYNSFSMDDSFSPKYVFEQRNMEKIITSTDNLLLEHLDGNKRMDQQSFRKIKSATKNGDYLSQQQLFKLQGKSKSLKSTPIRKITTFINPNHTEQSIPTSPTQMSIQLSKKSSIKKPTKTQSKRLTYPPKDPHLPLNSLYQLPQAAGVMPRKQSVANSLRRPSANSNQMLHLYNHLLQLQQIDPSNSGTSPFINYAQPNHFQNLHLQSGMHSLNPQMTIIRKKEEFFLGDFESMKEYVIYFPSQNYGAVIKKINMKVKINRLKKISEAPILQARKQRKRLSTSKVPHTQVQNAPVNPEAE